MAKPPAYMPRLPPSRATMRPTATMTDMAQRMAASRQRLADERRQDDDSLTAPLTTVTIIGALNDLTPSDPTPSDFTGSGGDFGGGGTSGDF